MAHCQQPLLTCQQKHCIYWELILQCQSKSALLNIWLKLRLLFELKLWAKPFLNSWLTFTVWVYKCWQLSFIYYAINTICKLFAFIIHSLYIRHFPSFFSFVDTCSPKRKWTLTLTQSLTLGQGLRILGGVQVTWSSQSSG